MSSHSLLLSLSHGGHEVVCNLPGVVLGVVLFDELVSLPEDVLAEVMFINSSKRESILRDVLHESFLNDSSGMIL